MRHAIVLLCCPIATALEPPAKLAVCTNINSCGRVGFGFGPQALECLEVIADTIDTTQLDVAAAPCLTRCSAGVNAKRLDAPGFYTGLNSYDAVGAVARELVGDDAAIGAVVASFAASEAGDAEAAAAAARALVDGPTRYGLAAAAWPRSRWVESFYGSELAFDGSGRATYNGGATLVGDADGLAFRGEYAEDGTAGAAKLDMAADGLSFAGTAVLDGEAWPWTGERLPEAAGEDAPARRWLASCLSARATPAAAAEAAAVAPRSPAAWEAVLATADDDATRRRALAALLFLEPPNRPGLPQAVANRRRAQSFELAKLKS
jgi:hypothetical protein